MDAVILPGVILFLYADSKSPLIKTPRNLDSVLKSDGEKLEIASSSDIKKGIFLILDNFELLIKISLSKLFLSVSILIGNLKIISPLPLPIKLF